MLLDYVFAFVLLRLHEQLITVSQDSEQLITVSQDSEQLITVSQEGEELYDSSYDLCVILPYDDPSH